MAPRSRGPLALGMRGLSKVMTASPAASLSGRLAACARLWRKAVSTSGVCSGASSAAPGAPCPGDRGDRACSSGASPFAGASLASDDMVTRHHSPDEAPGAKLNEVTREVSGRHDHRVVLENPGEVPELKARTPTARAVWAA